MLLGFFQPGIVFFGEEVKLNFVRYRPEFDNCDLLIVAGTSLSVQPFASLIDRVPKTTPRPLINRDEVGVKVCAFVRHSSFLVSMRVLTNDFLGGFFF